MSRSLSGCARGRGGAALFVCMALAVILGAFEFGGPLRPTALAAETGAAGGTVKQAVDGGIEMQARLLPGRTAIEKLFKKSLPDSGVVPVEISVRNGDSVAMTIFPPFDISGEGSGSGFELRVGGDTLYPLHPLEAALVVKGSGKAIRPPRSRSRKIIIGTMLPPLGGYYLYDELKTGRFVRPLVDRSLHRVLRSGIAEPLTLGPGEEAKGYLYFSMRQEDNPYRLAPESASDTAAAFEGEGSVPDCELYVRAYRSREFRDSIPILDAVIPRRESRYRRAPASRAVSPEMESGLSEESIVMILRESPSGGAALGWGRFGELRARFDEGFHEIAALSGSDAELAGACARGSRVACAINIKAKSRVYHIDLAGGPAGRKKYVSLPRRTEYLSLGEDRLIVVTNDGFGRALSLPDLEEMRLVKLGPDVKGVGRCGERLVVFDNMRGVQVYGAAGDEALREIERLGPLRGPDREVLSCDTEKGIATLLYRGPRERGDTLVVLELSWGGGVHERGRIPLNAPVAAADVAGTDALLQVDGGLLLLFDLAPLWDEGALLRKGGAPASESGIAPSQWGYVPFTLRTLSWDGERIAAIGENGELASGALDDFAPDERSMLEARSPLLMIQGEVEE